MQTQKIFKMELTQEQQIATDNIIEFFENKKHYYCLSGAAGTGKTFTIGKLPFGKYFKKVIFAAVSHKAVGVIRSNVNLEEQGNNFSLEFMTLTKLLNKKPTVNKRTGDINFYRAKRKGDNPNNGNDTLIIIDESSMLSDDDLLFICQDYAASKLLFLGDCSQIPSVDNPKFNIFDFFEQKGLITYLKTNMRSGQNNPLLLLANKNRSDEHNNGMYVFSDDDAKTNEIGGIITHPATNYLELLKQKKVDTIIVFTNKNKLAINTFCHDYFYGNVPYGIGEEIIFEEHTVKAKGIDSELEIYNSQIAKVMGMERHTRSFNVDIQFIKTTKENAQLKLNDTARESVTVSSGYLDVVSLYVCIRDLNGNYNENELWEVQVLQQSSKRNYSEFIKNLFKYTDKYQGKYLDEEYTIYSDFNDEKYLFYAQKFAVVDFVYAMTCHKAQGTTMKSVGVYVKDIWGDFNRKLFYTSITRAKQFAYILQ